MRRIINTLFTNVEFLRHPSHESSLRTLPTRRRSNSSISSADGGDILPQSVTVEAPVVDTTDSSDQDTDYDDGTGDGLVADGAGIPTTLPPLINLGSERGEGVHRLPTPGDTVTIHGLEKRPDLNGTRATVEIQSKWKGDRVAVRLASNPFQTLSIHPRNLTVVLLEPTFSLPPDPLLKFDNYEAELAEDLAEARRLADLEEPRQLAPTEHHDSEVLASVPSGLQWDLSKLRDGESKTGDRSAETRNEYEDEDDTVV